MIKLCGALLIISGTTCYGLFLAFQKKSRIQRLKALKETFIILMGQIRFAKSPIPQAFLMIAEKSCYTYIHDFYKYVSESLSRRTCKEFSEAWNMGIDLFIQDIFLTESDCAIIKNVGNMPLYLDAQMQLSILEETNSEIDKLITEAEKDIREKCRIYQSAGFILGLLIVLILI